MEGPTEDITTFLNAVARRTGALIRGQGPDLQQAAHFVIRRFRDGKFGPMTLDEDMEDPEKVREWSKLILSLNQSHPEDQGWGSHEGQGPREGPVAPWEIQSKRSIKRAERQAKIDARRARRNGPPGGK